jgi:hypothetical protein
LSIFKRETYDKIMAAIELQRTADDEGCGPVVAALCFARPQVERLPAMGMLDTAKTWQELLRD